jgi:hypothetical protein
MCWVLWIAPVGKRPLDVGLQIVLQVIESNVKRGSSVYEQDHVGSHSLILAPFRRCKLHSCLHVIRQTRFAPLVVLSCADSCAGMGRQQKRSGGGMEGAEPGVPGLPSGRRQGGGGAVLP